MSRAAGWKGGRRRLGPTVEEYKRAHPEVDWNTHEVLYTMHMGMGRSGPMVTEIKSHHRKFDYNALYRDLDDSDKVPSGTNWRRDNSWDGKVQPHWQWTRFRDKDPKVDDDE